MQLAPKCLLKTVSINGATSESLEGLIRTLRSSLKGYRILDEMSVFFFVFFFEFIDLNKQAVIYKAKALKQIQINSKGQP